MTRPVPVAETRLIPCPACGAEIEEPCRAPDGAGGTRPVLWHHAKRVEPHQ